jgi:hypothetical protein
MNTDIDALLDGYICAWNSMDFDTLQSLWDADEDEIHYLAEEIECPFYTLNDVIDYWSYAKLSIEWVSMIAANRRSKRLTDELCVVYYEMHVDLCMKDSNAMMPKPIGVDLNVSAILRKTIQGWRFIHYVEAPLGALPYLLGLYGANTRSRITGRAE